MGDTFRELTVRWRWTMRTIILIATILILCVFALPSHASAQVSLLDTSSMNKWAIVFGTKGIQGKTLQETIMPVLWRPY